VPVLLNTSFNLSGEPIVNRAVEGYSTFLRCGIDVLVAGQTRVMKRASSPAATALVEAPPVTVTAATAAVAAPTAPVASSSIASATPGSRASAVSSLGASAGSSFSASAVPGFSPAEKET
jgi:hypothetical protein